MDIVGEDPVLLLERIQKIIVKQQEYFDESYENLLKELEKVASLF